MISSHLPEKATLVFFFLCYVIKKEVYSLEAANKASANLQKKYEGATGVDLIKEVLTGKNIDAIKLIRTKQFTIKDSVFMKFRNYNRKKIIELMEFILKNGDIHFLKGEKADLGVKTHDFKIRVNFKKRIIENLLDNKEGEVKEKSIVFEKGVPKIEPYIEKKEERFNMSQFLKQIDLLQSSSVNVDKLKKAITEGEFNLKYTNLQHQIFVLASKDLSFKVASYNVESCITNDRSFLEGPDKSIKPLTQKEIDELDESYLSSISVIDMYGSYKKAKQYLDRLGLSVKTSSKFILENNENELHLFLISDIVQFGKVLYDNYMKNELIIRTNRFTYLIKNNVIINIKTVNMEEISICEYEFKRILNPVKMEKTSLLSLETGDLVKDYISRRYISKLEMAEHAVERYRERISRYEDLALAELEMKNDIYKNGEVIFGTYFKNTKLIKGFQNAYVVDNWRIISVWEYSEGINDIKEKYKTLIEEFSKDSGIA